MHASSNNVSSENACIRSGSSKREGIRGEGEEGIAELEQRNDEGGGGVGGVVHLEGGGVCMLL